MKAWIIGLALLALLFLSAAFAFEESSEEGRAMVPLPSALIINSATPSCPHQRPQGKRAPPHCNNNNPCHPPGHKCCRCGPGNSNNICLPPGRCPADCP
jgi:hypothetical protein